MNIYDISHDRYIDININNTKIHSLFVFEDIHYIISESIDYPDKIEISALTLEDYEKKNTIINLSISFKTLEYLESILIENYKFRLVKCE
jgi:hypothetical protein